MHGSDNDAHTWQPESEAALAGVTNVLKKNWQHQSISDQSLCAFTDFVLLDYERVSGHETFRFHGLLSGDGAIFRSFVVAKNVICEKRKRKNTR